MGILDRSKSVTEQHETNVNMPIQNESGIVAAGVGGDVTILNTDQNAFDNATQLAENAIMFARQTSEDASRLSLEQTRAIGDISAQSVSATGSAARDFASNLRGAISDVTEQALSFVQDTTTRAQSQLGSTVTALNTIAREQSKSTDERVAEVSGNAIKYGVIALVVAVVGFVAYGALKK